MRKSHISRKIVKFIRNKVVKLWRKKKLKITRKWENYNKIKKNEKREL